MVFTKQMFACLLAIMVCIAAVPAFAQVEAAVECKNRIDLVILDLDAIYLRGGIGGGNSLRTYNSLKSKLMGAQDKIDQRKAGDALQKLKDFKTAVEALRDAARPKMNANDATLLLDGDGDTAIDEGVNMAIACVALLE